MQPLDSERLVFRRDDSSVVHISRKSVAKRAILTIPLPHIAIAIFAIWFIAARFLAEYPSEIPVSYFLTSAAAVFIFVMVSIFLWDKNKDYRQLHSYKEPTGRMGKYIDGGRFAKKAEDGNYVMYKMLMPCTYPTCDGIVYISSAPSERGKAFIGSCTLDPFTHTYEVDANGFAAKAIKIRG